MKINFCCFLLAIAFSGLAQSKPETIQWLNSKLKEFGAKEFNIKDEYVGGKSGSYWRYDFYREMTYKIEGNNLVIQGTRYYYQDTLNQEPPSLQKMKKSSVYLSSNLKDLESANFFQRNYNLSPDQNGNRNKEIIIVSFKIQKSTEGERIGFESNGEDICNRICKALKHLSKLIKEETREPF